MLPMSLVKIVEIIGPAVVLVFSVMIISAATTIKRRAEGTNVWYFLYWFSIAEIVFAIARSIGHILRHILLTFGLKSVWDFLAPYSGGTNTITFVIVFVVTLLMAKSIREFSK